MINIHEVTFMRIKEYYYRKTTPVTIANISRHVIDKSFETNFKIYKWQFVYIAITISKIPVQINIKKDTHSMCVISVFMVVRVMQQKLRLDVLKQLQSQSHLLTGGSKLCRIHSNHYDILPPLLVALFN